MFPAARWASRARPTRPPTLLESDQASRVRSSVAGAGDVNGDGYGDVIVGPGSTTRRRDEGAASCLPRRSLGRRRRQSGQRARAARIENQLFGLLGSSSGAAGDLNGDGYADVVVGASGFDAGELDEGAAFVFHGSASGIAGRRTVDCEPRSSNRTWRPRVSATASRRGRRERRRIRRRPGRRVAVRHRGLPDEGGAFVFLGGASGVGDGDARPRTRRSSVASRSMHAWAAAWRRLAT